MWVSMLEKTAHPSSHITRSLHESACSCMVDPLTVDIEQRKLFSPASKRRPLSCRSAEAGEAALRVSRNVLWRRRQQRRLQRLLRALIQLAQRRHGAALPASDGGRGRGAEPLRQRQLVWEEGGSAGPAEPAQEPEDAQVAVDHL